MSALPITLSIAGSDCSAGAGLQADLKTFQHFHTYGLTAVTSVVAETPATVRSIHPVPPPILQDQLRVMLESYPVNAIKTGMLHSKAHIVAVAEILAEHLEIPLVVDPVMVASTGDPLLKRDAVDAYRHRLLPLATLITPNLEEAAILLDRPLTDEAAMEAAAKDLASTFNCAALVKGGHLSSDTCTDILCQDGVVSRFSSPRISTPASHGTGCTLSAAITARLAFGDSLPEAVATAKAFLDQALHQSLTLGPHPHLNQGTSLES